MADGRLCRIFENMRQPSLAQLSIRRAEVSDVPAIARIYNQGIDDHATLDRAGR